MEVFCPKCASATVVEPSAASAQCRACGADLPVHLPAFGPPSTAARPQAFGVEDMPAVQLVAPAVPVWPWMERQMSDGAWVVRVPRQGAGLVAAAFFVALVTAAMAYGQSSAKVPVAALLLLALAVGRGYRTLCALVNTGVLCVDAQWVAFRRGPLPQRGSFRLPVVAVTTFVPIRGPRVQTRGIKQVFWTVHAVFDTGATRLPLPWMDRDRADFVAHRLVQMLAEARQRAGLPPLPAPGTLLSPSAPF